MRFLCLHGQGSNSRVFETQTAAIRFALKGHDFEFVEASMPWPATPGFDQTFPDETEFFAWFDYSDPKTFDAAISDLQAYITSEGPFDGVLAISQSADLVSTFLLMKALRQEESLHSTSQCDHTRLGGFRFAVFFISTGVWLAESNAPGDSDASSFATGATEARVEEVGEALTIPVANIIGEKDEEHGKASKRLMKLCDTKKREVFVHSGGHWIPRDKESTKRMVDCIEKVIWKAECL